MKFCGLAQKEDAVRLLYSGGQTRKLESPQGRNVMKLRLAMKNQRLNKTEEAWQGHSTEHTEENLLPPSIQ